MSMHERIGRPMLLAGRLALGAALLAGSIASAAPAEAATADTDCAHVYIGPHVVRGGSGKSYFDLEGEPGASVQAGLVVANPGRTACTVRLAPATGRTATNSGDTYVPTAAGAGCTGTGCWVQGLPDSIRVSAGGRRVVAVSIAVPSGAKPGQYLAGIIGSPAGLPAASSGTGQVQVRLATRVAVGVAVRVPGPLRPHLTVPSVSVVSIGAGSRVVQVAERNDGNTWEHPHGALTVRVGDRSVRLPLTSSTVLAGDTARLAVGADAVAAGVYPAQVRLQYGSGQVASWSGPLTFAAPAAAVQEGSKVVVTSEVVPAWAAVLIGVAGGLLLLVVVLALLLLRRRRGPRGGARIASS